MTPMPATCDTSVLVAALADWHPVHGVARQAVLGRVTSIPAHSILECYSVLTRLPAGHRVTASVAGEVLDRTGLLLLGCPPDVQRTMVRRLASAGIAGGAVYDGLAAATARHHGLPLLTLDRRARATYETLGAAFEMLVHD